MFDDPSSPVSRPAVANAEVGTPIDASPAVQRYHSCRWRQKPEDGNPADYCGHRDVQPIAGTTGFVVIPRRWIVERTLGWFGRWRRLSKDYEELPEVSEAMVTLAAIRMMLQRLVHPNRKRLPAP